jgi:hypothetical protein
MMMPNVNQISEQAKNAGPRWAPVKPTVRFSAYARFRERCPMCS